MAEAIRMPKLGFDMAEGTLVRWMIDDGQPVAKGQVIAEIETDKATVEVDTQVDGVLHKHLIQAGTIVPIGTPIAIIAVEGEEVDIDALVSADKQIETAPAVEEVQPDPAPAPIAAPKADLDPSLPQGVRASPIARRIARERGLDLATIRGSGPGGRIVKRDVEGAVAAPIPATTYVAPAVGEESREPLSKLRTIIGKRMTQAKQEVPHFYITIDIDADPLMDLRRQFNALIPEDEKLSINDFIVKAAALNLQRFPSLNASLDGDQIVRHGNVNVGMAVAVDDGLLTVVIRDANLKPLRQIGSEAREMVARARAGRVRPDDIEGSTFTVSNMGMFDVDHFIAIINPPEAAILAVGSVRQDPVVVNGKIVIGQRMKVTLSADHRVTDGAEAARWLQAFAKLMQEPLQLVIS
jgi:pyruvate dehydrogenase E2 component (dihydrolipoamide acetyltransferase)